jgi:hypothetical protein
MKSAWRRVSTTPRIPPSAALPDNPYSIARHSKASLFVGVFDLSGAIHYVRLCVVFADRG